MSCSQACRPRLPPPRALLPIAPPQPGRLPALRQICHRAQILLHIQWTSQKPISKLELQLYWTLRAPPPNVSEKGRSRPRAKECEWSAKAFCVLLLWCHTGAAGGLRAQWPPSPPPSSPSKTDLPPAAGAVAAEREPVTAITLGECVRVPRERLSGRQHGPGRAVGAVVHAAVGESE